MFVSTYNELAYQFIETFNWTKAPPVTIIVGKKGLGKTTCLENLFQKAKDNITKTLLIDARKFASKYAYAACNGELSSLRKYFRSSRLFLLDNIELLQGKQKTIEELFHTLDTIIAQDGKIVITYGGEGYCFDYLGSRFASRLNSGLVIRINEPSKEEINSFAEYYLACLKQPQLAEVLPRLKKTSIKQVAEDINRFLEDSGLEEISSAPREAQALVNRVNLVLGVIADYYGVSDQDVRGRSKKTKYVQARYMTYVLLHEIYKYDYREIARFFGKSLSGLQSRCTKFQEDYRETFATLCHKLYNQLD